MYSCLIIAYIDLRINCVSLQIGSYNIKLVFIVYW